MRINIKENTNSILLKNLGFSNQSKKLSAKILLSILGFTLFNLLIFFPFSNVYSQTGFQQGYIAQPPQNNSYFTKSSAFNQEIARMEITVVREGKAPLSITQVPRLQKDDVIKVRLLDELVNGVKLDQSNWDWSFIVAFVNPSRNNDQEKSVSNEIQFRKTGWYKEYSFVVPYESQPLFFIYPKPKYRDKIKTLINKNSEEIRKVGEKTLEIANAYAKIGSFLNELQSVLNRNQYGSGYGGFGGFGTTNSYSSGFGSFGSTTNPAVPYNYNALVEQSIERLARSFNINLPQCWGGNGNGFGSGYGSSNTFSGSSFGSFGNNNYGYAINQELIGRAQCVAKSVRLEDFDFSVSRLLQQGGILGIAQLRDKYPQLAYWINLTAAAVDFIIKAFGKSPLRVVPTLVSTSDNQTQGLGFQTNFATNQPTNPAQPKQVKISLFAESQPNSAEFVTAYPLVVHKWQANADSEIINLPTPMLMEPCLHVGQNILRSTDLLSDWMSDTFTKDFQLVISSPNGFKKQFPLTKNLGMSGWELNVTKEDLDSFPKINMFLEAYIVGARGFNEIKSPNFDLPIPVTGNWEVETKSQKGFAVGAKRTVTLKNQFGNCRCLQAVIYKPSFGGQFIYEASNKDKGISFSSDGKEVSFEVDATYFQPGQGQLELKQYGGGSINLELTLFPAPPKIDNLKIYRGDNQAIITGEGLEQLKAIKINGRRAVLANGSSNFQTANIQNAVTNAPPTGSMFGVPNSLTANQNNVVTAPSNISTTATNASYGMPTEKIFIFEDRNVRLDSKDALLELELDGNRTYQYPQTFNVSAARPLIVTDANKEVLGIAVNAVNKTGFTFNNSLMFPFETKEISVDLQNALTDYDFRLENIQIETRIANASVTAAELPRASFEVWDWKNLHVKFQLNEQSQKLLSGRKLQFRIRDRSRGDSDWFTVKQTFVRIPEPISIKCGNATVKNCEINGVGIEYISQVSLDNGKTWFPQSPTSITVQTGADGRKFLTIPNSSKTKLLQIKLRDFPLGEGLVIK